MGEAWAAVLGAAVLEEGRWRTGGGVGEAGGKAVGEAQAESLVGDADEAVVGVVGESGVAGESGVGTPGNGVAHRGRLLEGDADAAARGVFDSLLGLVVEFVVPQAVTERSQAAEMGAGARATHPSDRRTWPRSMRRTMEGDIAWVRKVGKGACVCVCKQEQGGSARPSKECVRKVNVFAF